MTEQENAAAQLAVLEADRVALADRLVQPWWYDVCLGLLLFGFLVSCVVDSPWVTLPAFVVFLLGMGALVSAYKRSTGVWMSAGGGALWWWAGVVLLVPGTAFALAETYDRRWTAVALAAVLAVALGVLSRSWGRAYVAQLRKGL